MTKYVVFTGHNPAVPFPHFELRIESLSVDDVVECRHDQQVFHFRVTEIDSWLMTAKAVLHAKGAT
ncbi:MAG: hypothetical protein WCV69_01340 [Patescibacteria group bacterium]|jgi:hypothetical protein